MGVNANPRAFHKLSRAPRHMETFAHILSIPADYNGMIFYGSLGAATLIPGETAHG